MDLRVMKTTENIKTAFIALRKHKPIEKITIKELCEKAVINKATFYLHYHDIYDLSENLEDALISDCVAVIDNKDLYSARTVVTKLVRSVSENSELIKILFSDSRINSAVKLLEKKLTERIYEERPLLKDNIDYNIRLTAAVYGCFHAYLAYSDKDVESLIDSFVKSAEDCIYGRK